MSPLPIIIDCDPGTDDAVALLMAMAFPERFNLLAITTVGGNVSLERVTKNALMICELAGRTEIPVAAGCGRPLVKPASTAEFIHGISGLGNAQLPHPTKQVEPIHGVDLLIETILNHPEPVTVCLIGPQTNMAMALVKEPKIKENIREIVFMGGAVSGGNVPGGFAEFNIFNDPHAAHVVCTSELNITMVGLDVTHTVVLTSERLKRIMGFNNPIAIFIDEMMSFGREMEKERFGFDGNLIHDACVIGYLLNPEHFKGRKCPLFVEINSHSVLGKTVVDWHNWTKNPANAHVVIEADVEGFFENVVEAIKRYK